MDKFKLSICLPTYNQSKELEKLFESIAPQITSEIEVIVRDDSPNDNTEYVVDKFSKIFPIRYFHGEKEGVDNALIFLFEQAQGEFVWWVGDDDITQNCIPKILEAIKKYPEVTFIWANFQIDGSDSLGIDFPSDCFFKDHNELLEKAVVGLGYISSCIFRRSSALIGLEKSRGYIGSEFVSLYLILQAIAYPGKCYYLRGPIVICYPTLSDEVKAKVVKDGKIKNAAFEVFGINFAKILREFEGPFSSRAIRRVIRKSFGQTWRGMLVGWVGGWDTPEGKRLRMIKYFWNFPEAYIAFVLFLIPLSINKLLYKTYKIFFSHRHFRFREINGSKRKNNL